MSTTSDSVPDDEGSVTRVIRRMKSGDDSGVSLLWERFYNRLRYLVRDRLRHQLKTVADEEDLALESLAELFKGILEGRYANLDDRESLWRLLVTVASRNVIDEVNRERRQKRGSGKVLNESAVDGTTDGQPALFERVPSTTSTPDVQVMIMERCRLMLESLQDEELQAIAIMKTAGWGNREIAESMGTSLRSVERRLSQIRDVWSKPPA